MAIRIRALEREDLGFVHGLTNDSKIMRYWFEEPYESLVELREIFDRHIHDIRERRFIIVGTDSENTGRVEYPVGVVELMHIDPTHRNCEFQIIVAPDHQGHGYATAATVAALDYAFAVLNLHKVYLVVDVSNTPAIGIYKREGFQAEGTLRQEYFANGRYRDALRMGMLQHEYFARRPPQA